MATRKKEKRQPRPIFVQFARVGGEVKRYCLDGARTVEALLEFAEDSLDTEDRVRVNGKPATESTKLKSNDVVTVAGRVAGGL